MWSDATWQDALTDDAPATDERPDLASFLGVLLSIVRGTFSPVVLLVALVAAFGSLGSSCGPVKTHQRTTDGVVFLLAVLAIVLAGVLTSAVSKGCSYLLPSTRPRTVFLAALLRAAVGLLWIVPVALLVTQPGSTWTVLVWVLAGAGSIGGAVLVSWMSSHRRARLRTLSTTSAAVGVGSAVVAFVVLFGPAHGSFQYYTTCSSATFDLTNGWVCDSGSPIGGQ
jgi:hypothetical protein